MEVAGLLLLHEGRCDIPFLGDGTWVADYKLARDIVHGGTNYRPWSHDLSTAGHSPTNSGEDSMPDKSNKRTGEYYLSELRLPLFNSGYAHFTVVSPMGNNYCDVTFRQDVPEDTQKAMSRGKHLVRILNEYSKEVRKEVGVDG